jgi:hypothetical protein
MGGKKEKVWGYIWMNISLTHFIMEGRTLRIFAFQVTNFCYTCIVVISMYDFCLKIYM